MSDKKKHHHHIHFDIHFKQVIVKPIVVLEHTHLFVSLHEKHEIKVEDKLEHDAIIFFKG